MSLPIKSDSLEVVSGGAFNPSVTSGTTDPTLGLSRPEGSIYLRYVVSGGQAFIKFGPADTDWDVIVTGGGGIGGNLDDAYDFGGAGAGRTIIADSGALQLNAFTTNTQAALTINRQPGGAAAAVGIDLVLNGNVSAAGAGIQIADAGVGTSLKVTKSNAGSVYFADLTNAGAKALEVVVTAAPTSVSPISVVANTTGTTAALISVSKIPGGSTAGNGISVSMGANTTGAGIISTNAGPGAAVAAINSSSTAGAMSIQNTNAAGPVDFYATDSGGTARMSWGYGNSGYSDAARASRGYVWRNTGVDFVIARTGVTDVMVKSNGKVGFGTDDPAGVGYGFAADVQVHIQKASHSFLLIDTTTAANDSGIIFSTLTSPTDAAIFLDESDSQKLKFATGNVDNDANRNTNTRLTIYQTGQVDITSAFSFNPTSKVFRIIQSAADPADGTGALTLQNTLSTSISQITWRDHAGVFKGALGLSNDSSGIGPNYFYLENSGKGLLFSGAGGSSVQIYAGVVNQAGTQYWSGNSLGVSAASTGRIRYNTGTQTFQVSMNGAAYVDITTGATFTLDIGDSIGGSTVGSVLFVGAGNVLQQDNANLFFDNTNNRLGVGMATPFYSLDVASTGASQIHISNGGVDSGGYLTSTVATQMYISGGLAFDGTNLRAKATSAEVVELINGAISFQTATGLTIGAISAMTERMLIHSAGGIEIFNSDAATVSSASRGKIRYTTSGQKPQWSSNGGAYFDLAQLAAPLTYSAVAASIPFADVNGRLQQDNTNFNWDVTNTNLNVYGSSATGGSLFLRNTNVSDTGPSAIGFLNRTGTFKTYVGFFPSAYAFTHLQGINGYFAFGGEDIALANSTVNQFRFGMTAGSAFMAAANGSSAAVSAANTGRLRYNSGTQTFQVSLNGAAYTDLTTAAPFTLDIGDAIGSSTVGSVLFVGAGNVLQQDNANFFWDDTNNRLGIGTTAPGVSLDISSATTVAAIALRAGSTAAVSAASTGRVRYDESVDRLQGSQNAGAYADFKFTTTEYLSADGAADPAIETSFVSGSGTDLTLANGTRGGFIKNFVITGGSGTITPTNLADGDVLTWTASPANVSFIWDATNTTWHVIGNPYNMVTT